MNSTALAAATSQPKTHMVLGWVFGRHMVQHDLGKTRVSPATVMLVGGICAIALFVVLRALPAGYGDMFLPRTSDLVHRLVLELPATYFGLSDTGDLTTTFVVGAPDIDPQVSVKTW